MFEHTYKEVEAYWRELNKNERRELIEDYARIRSFYTSPQGAIFDSATHELCDAEHFDDVPGNDIEFYAFMTDGYWEGCAECIEDMLDQAFEAVWTDIELPDADDDGRLSDWERNQSLCR